MNSLKKTVALLLTIAVFFVSMPNISVNADAANHMRDITDSISVEMEYKAQDGDEWIQVDPETFNKHALEGFIITVNWSLKDKNIILDDGDYFIVLDSRLPEGEVIPLTDGSGTSIGELTVEDDGSAKAVFNSNIVDSSVKSGSVSYVYTSDMIMQDTLEEGTIHDVSETLEEDTDYNVNETEPTNASEQDSIGISNADVRNSANDAESFGQISLVKFKKVRNGYLWGMALDESGAVWVWGFNAYGTLGVGSNFDIYYGGMKRLPYFVENDIKIVDISVSYQAAMALSDTGEVYTWGRNEFAQGGIGYTSIRENTPVKVNGLPEIVQIYGSKSEHVGTRYAVDVNGDVWVWGTNQNGQAGINSAGYILTPRKMIWPTGMGDIKDIAGGLHHTLVRDGNGDIWYCGDYNAYGMLGNGGIYGGTWTFTKMNKPAGMGNVIDIDAVWNYSAAITDDGKIWEWGVTFTHPSASYGGGYTTESPTEVLFDESEVSTIGYTPIPQAISAGALNSYIIDQHGRPWCWGSNNYFGFGRDGGYGFGSNNTMITKKAQQWPKELGDGDTQINDRDPKYPVYLVGSQGKTANYWYNYTFESNYGSFTNTLHPTIYDEKYMWKDSEGYVLDEEGNRLKYIRMDSERPNLNYVSGYYYKLNEQNNLTLERGTPAVDPTERYWIDLAGKDVPYIAEIDVFISAYTMLDRDGNIYKWALDGSGAIAWGWDYEEKYDGTNTASIIYGLYDRYLYEPMYMRGAPNIDNISLSVYTPESKIYLTGEPEDSDTAKVSVYIPAGNYNLSLESEVYTTLNSLKYVFIPYDTSNPDFSIDPDELTNEEFLELYNKYSERGELVNEPILSERESQHLTYEIPVIDNGRLIIWAENERYANDGYGSGKYYTRVDYIGESYIADNFYTPTLQKHYGSGEVSVDESVSLYAATDDNVVKLTDDTAVIKLPAYRNIYGLPLDANGQVIGTAVDSDGNVTITEVPTFGYDEVEIRSYEAVNDAGLPAGIKPYWKFKEYLDTTQTMLQPKTEVFELNDRNYLIKYETSPETGNKEAVYYEHEFIYERNNNYWTEIEGEKLWDDMEDAFGLRPDSIGLILKQYERDPLTGEMGDFIQDLARITLEPDDDGRWLFNFGFQKSFEYTYEIVEVNAVNYETAIEYTNLSVGPGINENFTDIVITNTLVVKPIKFVKVDPDNNLITVDKAHFTLTNAVEGGKVLDENGIEQNSLNFVTDGSDSFISVPFQKTGTYLLRETKAPKGYNLLTKDIVIEIESNGSIFVSIGDISLTEISLDSEEKEKYSYGYYIVNKVAAELPGAGGSGSLPFIVAGLLLMYISLRIVNSRKIKS